MGLQLVHIGNYDYQLFCKKREHRASPGSHAPSPESHAHVLAARTARLAVLLVASGVVALTTWSLWQSDAQEAWEELCGVAGCAQSACASLLRHIFLDIPEFKLPASSGLAPRHVAPQTGATILTAHNHSEFFRESITLGRKSSWQRC